MIDNYQICKTCGGFCAPRLSSTTVHLFTDGIVDPKEQEAISDTVPVYCMVCQLPRMPGEFIEISTKDLRRILVEYALMEPED